MDELGTIYRPNDKLLSLTELEEMAKVTDEDINLIIEQWINNPPDTEFSNILNAEDA